MSLEEYLDAAGTVPIPPYFHRDAEASDKEAYNNVYAAAGGSVAAPTAGLHFTQALLKEIGAAERDDSSCSFLSLHVGAGTFKPVLVLDARDHSMHAETFSVSVAEIHRIIGAIEKGKPIMAVGTTSARTLESLYWCGVKRMRGLLEESDTSCLVLGQFEWEAWILRDADLLASRQDALSSLIGGLDKTDFVCGKTSLMIVPGTYDFKVVDHLVTNFHAPDSTLMLLVSAFLESGQKIKTVYEDAQRHGFKFLSYGDVCLLSRPRQQRSGSESMDGFTQSLSMLTSL
jgi:S-adenosylmethionine:tRNA ribosyltransferase-isomerase